MKLKVLGLMVALAGFGINLASNWVSDKQMEKTIDEKVNEALEKKNKEQES